MTLKLKPARVLITGGHELGGVDSFAAGLGVGFSQLGISAEIVAPRALVRRWRDLRDTNVLKILSTSAVFAAPLARRAICIAHGIPRADVQGWSRVIGLNLSYKVANASPDAQLVAVSYYIAETLGTTFNLRFDGVIHNPVKPIYLEPLGGTNCQRTYITFVGRLVASKNIHRLLPALSELLRDDPTLRVSIIGDGPQRRELEAIANHDERIEFKGNPDDKTVRECLRRTRLFISGNTTEGLGITYLEALSQGCIVAMPAGGGGIELGLEQIGTQIHLLPLSLEPGEVAAVLRRAIHCECIPMSLDKYACKAVAEAYLQVDSRRARGYLGRSEHKSSVGSLNAGS